MNQKLRVAINAQFVPESGVGGIETVVIELASVLGRLDDGAEEYVFIVHPDAPDWLRPVLSANQSVVIAPRDESPIVEASSTLTNDMIETMKRMTGSLRPVVRQAWRAMFPLAPPIINLAESNGFYESLECDAIHFPYQRFTKTALPSIFNPHDLQHRHFPQFFDAYEIAFREATYSAACRAAHAVAVASEWVKRDVIQSYDINPDKIQVIPWAAPPRTYSAPTFEKIAQVKADYNLPATFALYPAMTWEHKNHLRLLEAVAVLREIENLKINIVCTGHKTDFWQHIETRRRELRLEDQVLFTGRIPAEDLGVMYQCAQFVVVPTLFEAMSAPVFEAWREGAAAACSDVTALPEQAGDAALLFDASSIKSIADALKRMTLDENTRADLRRRGSIRLNDFSSQRTAKAYRALYRQVARRTLSEEDLSLLKH